MIHLITYGNDNFKLSKKRIFKEAQRTEWFDSIKVFGPEDLSDKFKLDNKNILEQHRGGGYWIWKIYIIKTTLEKINDNDILIYLDSGCTINKKGEKRFYEYINMLNNSEKGIISFQMNFVEKLYTTKEIFNYFKINNQSEIANSGQIIGGILIMKKNNHLINIINLLDKTLCDNSLLFTDYYNSNQESYFIDNRHDQSVSSVIRKIYGSIILKDETFFEHFGNKTSLDYPFWATRLR